MCVAPLVVTPPQAQALVPVAWGRVLGGGEVPAFLSAFAPSRGGAAPAALATPVPLLLSDPTAFEHPLVGLWVQADASSPAPLRGAFRGYGHASDPSFRCVWFFGMDDYGMVAPW